MIDVVLPVLDEAEAIRWVLPRLPDGYRALVVDNGSTDGSAAVAAELGAEVVEAPVRGFGSACFTGLTRATSELVCFMDCDASLDPRELPALVERVESGAADLVLGRRMPARRAWPVHARFANRVLARDVRRRTGLPLRDLGPMRVARRRPLLDLDLRDRRSGWPLEMVLAAVAAGWRVEELPVPYLARSGRSKVTGTVRGTIGAVQDMRAQLNRFAGERSVAPVPRPDPGTDPDPTPRSDHVPD